MWPSFQCSHLQRILCMHVVCMPLLYYETDEACIVCCHFLSKLLRGASHCKYFERKKSHQVHQKEVSAYHSRKTKVVFVYSEITEKGLKHPINSWGISQHRTRRKAFNFAHELNDFRSCANECAEDIRYLWKTVLLYFSVWGVWLGLDHMFRPFWGNLQARDFRKVDCTYLYLQYSWDTRNIIRALQSFCYQLKLNSFQSIQYFRYCNCSIVWIFRRTWYSQKYRMLFQRWYPHNSIAVHWSCCGLWSWPAALKHFEGSKKYWGQKRKG